MIDRVVVGIDGSVLSRVTFEYSAMIAEAARIPIHLVHVAEDDTPFMVADIDDPDQMFRIDEVIRSCEAFAEWRNLKLTTEIVEGDVVHYFASHTRATDMLVIGLKGRFERVGLGSTTRWLVSHASGPIMVVAGLSERHLNRLIAAYDGSDGSTRAIRFARDFAAQLNWPLTVLAVPGRAHPLDEVLERAQEYAPQSQVITFDLAGRKPVELIEDVHARSTFALLVLGAYSDSLFHQALGGGVTGHVLTHIQGPVVMIR